MIASRPLRVRCGIGLPHCLQKAVAKLLACGRSKRATDPAPRSQRTADAFTITSQEWAGPGRFPTSRTVAVQEAVKGAIDFEYDLAADATSPVCRHPHLPRQSNGFGSGSCVSRHVGKWHFSDMERLMMNVGFRG